MSDSERTFFGWHTIDCRADSPDSPVLSPIVAGEIAMALYRSEKIHIRLPFGDAGEMLREEILSTFAMIFGFRLDADEFCWIVDWNFTRSQRVMYSTTATVDIQQVATEFFSERYLPVLCAMLQTLSEKHDSIVLNCPIGPSSPHLVNAMTAMQRMPPSVQERISLSVYIQ